MGQVVQLPDLLRYPEASTDLDPPECVLLIAMRWWVADRQQGETRYHASARPWQPPAHATRHSRWNG